MSSARVESAQSLPSGTRLEEFLIERVLGSGGFGITYLARDTRLGRAVVIKENLPAQFAYRDTHSLTVAPRHARGEDADDFQWALTNFTREAETLASLDHVGIVRVLRSFEAFGTAYFVMPLVEGESLDEVVAAREARRQMFGEDEVLVLLERTLDALGYLHARQMYHRDIKPANILMTRDGVPILIDFGSARQRLCERSMTVVESAGYTPFEQLQSHGNIGPWSDLYALGATVARVIAGEAPPKANDRAFDDPWVPLAARRYLHGRFSRDFLACVDRALEVQIRHRWSCADEWRDALAPRRETGESPTTARRGAAMDGGGGGGVPGGGDSPGGARSRTGAAVTFTAVLAGLAGAAGIWKFGPGWQQGPSTQDTLAPVEVADNPPTKEPERYLAAFGKLESLLARGELGEVDAGLNGLRLMEMNEREEARFNRLQVRFNQVSAQAVLRVRSRVSPVGTVIKVDGVRKSGVEFEVKGYGEHLIHFSAEGHASHEVRVRVQREDDSLVLDEVRLVKLASDMPPQVTRSPDPPPRVTQDDRPAPAPATPPEIDHKAELARFVGTWVGVQSSNDINDHGELLEDRVDYQYVKTGLATRAQVLNSIRENVERWPVRQLEVRDDKFTWSADGNRGYVSFIMDYQYSDHQNRRAAGATNVSLGVVRTGGRWRVEKYHESVERSRNDKKGSR